MAETQLGVDSIGWFSSYPSLLDDNLRPTVSSISWDDIFSSTSTSLEANSDANYSSVTVGVKPSSAVRRGDCQRLTNFIINTVFAGILCVVGLAGNTVSFSVLGRDTDMLPVARFLLRSLAVADNIFLCVYFLNFSLRDLFAYSGVDRRYFNPWAWLHARLVSYPLMFMAQSATIWLTVVVAASRCLAVCLPHRASVYCSLSATRIAVASVALFSVAYNMPRYFETTVVREVSPVNENRTVIRLRRTQFGLTESYSFVYLDVLYYMFGFALPLFLLTIFNTTLIVVYQRFRRKRAAMQKARTASNGSRRKTTEASEQNVTLIMIAVVLVFVITNVPAKVVQIAWSYREQTCPSIRYLVVELSVVFELLGSAINFFVYCAFLRRFRRHLAASCPSIWHRLMPANLLDEADFTTGDTTMLPLHQRPISAPTDFGVETPLVDVSRGCLDDEKSTKMDVKVGGTPVTFVDCGST